MKIGFIGLGNMGRPMAQNLLKAGHQLVGYDIKAGEAADAIPIAETASQAAKDQDAVITMLPDGTALKDVASQIIPHMQSGAAFIDCSTVDVDTAVAVALEAEGHGHGLIAVDAPVSGGIGGAAAGSLTFMVGGSEAGFKMAEPLFQVMGQKAVHCGTHGTGQAAKICNNMILGITMIGTCEAFVLADRLGLDRQKMFDVVSTSSGASWSMNTYCPAPGVGPNSPADNDYQPGFAAELMAKDLGLAQEAARSVDALTPLGAMAARLYRQFVDEEDGRGQDFSAMLPRFTQKYAQKT